MIWHKTIGGLAVVVTAVFALLSAPTALMAAPGDHRLKAVASFKGGAHKTFKNGALTRGGDGELYGVLGTNRTCGAIYRVRPGEGITIVHDFADGAQGCGLVGTLLLASDGYLYGTTAHGGTHRRGVVFRFDPKGEFKVVTHFTPAMSVARPVGGLLEGQDGLLYGTSENGGMNGGTIFSVSKDGHVQVLYFLDERSGEYPNGQLLQLADGSLLGTTYAGGLYGRGVLFRNDLRGGHTILHDFTGNEDGAFPGSGLVAGVDGKLYGAVIAGGLKNAGALYRTDADGSNFQVIYHPEWATGAQPRGRLIRAQDGRMLGTMALAGGGSDNEGDGNGVVFSIDTNGHYRVLARLDLTTVGGWPDEELTDVGDGVVYGLTSSGGKHNAGTVFRFAYPLGRDR
jgi:uncharacterized repeat protein (TIGR03803 family)